MAGLAQGLAFIIAKLVALAKFIGLLAVAVFVAGWDFVRDAFTWVFEQCVTLVVSVLGAVDVSGAIGVVAANAAIPGEIAGYLGALGFGTAFGIVTTAIGIRFVLQLIPFTRLGS